MSDPFVGEIRMFAGNFAPAGWALCDGQLLAISQYDALFSLFGTLYGGDGVTTFGLPDFRGRAPVHMNQAGGYPIGQKAGGETVTLTNAQLAGHTHSWQASTSAGTDQSAVAEGLAQSSVDAYRDNPPAPSYAALANDAVQPLGGSAAHNNMMPYQAVSFIVSLVGIYPSRT